MKVKEFLTFAMKLAQMTMKTTPASVLLGKHDGGRLQPSVIEIGDEMFIAYALLRES